VQSYEFIWILRHFFVTLHQNNARRYATIPEFMIFSGLKRDSAKAYLDSLCKGDHPRLWKVRESRRWLYFPKKEASTE
jgi:hypothetical protein